jgi:hypothetical protein
MTKVNGLSARLKSCPVTKHFKIDFSRSLFSRGRENACMKAALAAEGKTFPQHRALELWRETAKHQAR